MITTQLFAGDLDSERLYSNRDYDTLDPINENALGVRADSRCYDRVHIDPHHSKSQPLTQGFAMSNDQNFQFKDKSSLHKCRTEIPNIIKSLKLSGNEFLLYFHYKSVAGDDSACWQSLKTLSEETGLSEKTIKEINKKLCQPRVKLDGLPLISLEHRFKKDGSRDTSFCKLSLIFGQLT